MKIFNNINKIIQSSWDKCKLQSKLDEHEFLPAVLEIQETPPAPLGRLITWLIALFFTITLIWAITGEIDIVSTAQGKIIPSSHSKIIQPVEISLVTAIHVREGQSVKTGDVLIELDATETGANQTSSQQQLNALKQSQIRLQALIALIKNPVLKNSAKLNENLWEESKTKLENSQFYLLENQYNQYKAQKQSLKATLREKQSELKAIQAKVEQLIQTVPLIEKRLSSVESLFKQELIAEAQYLELKQQWIEQKQSLEAQKHISKQLEAEIDQINSQTKQYQYEYQRDQLFELVETERQLKGLHQELIKTRQRNKQQILKSPINGVVQQLAVHTIGGVVSPAEALMVIVPEDDILEVEAYLENKDIGFVEENQIAEIKIDAFPFTKYGVIDGTVISISNDAIQHEQLGLVFAMRASMKKSDMNINGKLVNLSPGMSVIVEIKTGKRKIIEYLARPVEVMAASALRER
ncbi:MAG: HlyD family type I secretion periplasmic adaptor subunit [Pseudomonadota bacterium]